MGTTRSVLIVNTVIGLGLAALNYLAAPTTNLRDIWSYLLGNMIYAHVIGTTAALVVPKVAMRIWHLRGPQMWII